MPKQHFIQHYSELIRKFGPLKHLEPQDLNRSTNISKRIKNYENITLSLVDGRSSMFSIHII